MDRQKHQDIRLNDYMVLRVPELDLRSEIYNSIHAKITHILENRKLSKGEQVDRLTELFMSNLKDK